MKRETCKECLYYDSCPHTGLCEHYYNASMDDEMAIEYIEDMKIEYVDMWRRYIVDFED